MTKSKLSVSIDPIKLEIARSLVPTDSTSELLDVALARLIDDERERQHVEGYVRIPVDGETIKWAKLKRRPLDDDIDWAALYEIER